MIPFSSVKLTASILKHQGKKEEEKSFKIYKYFAIQLSTKADAAERCDVRPTHFKT